MIKNGFRFELGNFKCLVVSDGTLKVPDPPSKSGESKFKRPGEVIEVLCLFIDAGERKILVDTGCGEGFQDTAGKLVRNLADEGIYCADVDTIIYTHGHGDHAGGSFDSEGDPVYPNANYVVAKKEWECWQTLPDNVQFKRMFSAALKSFLPIPDKFRMVEYNEEIFPGIKLLPAPGHTPGNSMLEISSGAHRLLCVGDTIHTPLELSLPDYYSFLDFNPKQAIRTRDGVLSNAAKSGLTIFACHFPSPGLGHIVKNGNQFSWQPTVKKSKR